VTESKGYGVRTYSTLQSPVQNRLNSYLCNLFISRSSLHMSQVLARRSLARGLTDLGIRREGKWDRDQNLLKFEANSGLFNENLREFWPISAFP